MYRIYIPICFLVSCVIAMGAAEEEVPEPITFRLEYRAEGFAKEINVPLEGREYVFKKEPNFSGHDVLRAGLALGGGKNEFIGFAWDQTANELYLDQNRNLDLTDDHKEPFHTESEHVFVRFKNVPLNLERAGISLAYVLEFEFFKNGSYVSCGVSIQSGWHGEFKTGEMTYKIALLDNLDGELTRQDPFILSDTAFSGTAMLENAVTPGRGGQADFGIPNQLALDGIVYEFSMAFEPGESATAIMGTLTQSQSPMGTLNIEGTHIRRLALDGPPRIELFAPAQTAQVPVGEYRVSNVALEGGLCANRMHPNVPRIAISAFEPAQLRVGGPLKHALHVNRRGRTLDLNHNAMQGIGGETYTTDDSLVGPSFAIYQGERKLVAGNFEYG